MITVSNGEVEESDEGGPRTEVAPVSDQSTTTTTRARSPVIYKDVSLDEVTPVLPGGGPLTEAAPGSINREEESRPLITLPAEVVTAVLDHCDGSTPITLREPDIFDLAAARSTPG